MKTLNSIALMSILLAMGGNAFAAQTLTADEIRRELIGSTMNMQDKNGLKGTVKHHKNGKSEVNIPSKKFSDKGSWRLKGNALCVKWQKVRGGKEGCFTFSKSAKGYVDSAGTISWK